MSSKELRKQFEDEYPVFFGIYFNDLADGYTEKFNWATTQCMLQNARWDAWKRFYYVNKRKNNEC